jgi:molybdate transport system ATP-binding protein
VAVSVYPWEIALAAAGWAADDSSLNHLAVEVISLTAVGNRIRVGLAAPQPLSAELTAGSAARLALAPGVRAVASFKATATRLLDR